jgi:hypothetical protein
MMQEHMKGPEAQARELEELTQIYVGRGLSYSLAKQVNPICFKRCHLVKSLQHKLENHGSG